MIKRTDEKPDEEIQRGKPGRVLSAGTHVPMGLWTESNTIRTFIEASSHRHA